MILSTVEMELATRMHRTGVLMPYDALIRRLESRIRDEKNDDRREELQVQLILLLGLLEVKKSIGEIVQRMDKPK